MIKPLRKRHFQIWAILAFLIPAGIVSAYLAVPQQAFSNLLQQDKTTPLPVIVNKAAKKNYSVYLRSSNDKKEYQLQWVNKKQSDIPSSLIYKINNTQKELIGRIASEDNYFFALPKDTTQIYHFILYDIIHQQTIDSIKF